MIHTIHPWVVIWVPLSLLDILHKVVIFLEQREVGFLSPNKICENLNFSIEIHIFANFAG